MYKHTYIIYMYLYICKYIHAGVCVCEYACAYVCVCACA